MTQRTQEHLGTARGSVPSPAPQQTACRLGRRALQPQDRDDMRCPYKSSQAGAACKQGLPFNTAQDISRNETCRHFRSPDTSIRQETDKKHAHPSCHTMSENIPMRYTVHTCLYVSHLSCSSLLWLAGDWLTPCAIVLQ